MTPRLRFAVWSVTASLLLVGQFVWLLLLRGPRVLTSDATLIGGQILLTFPVLLIALLLKTTPADAITLRRRTSEWIVLGGVALLQLAAVALLRPALSEDLLRYRVDGRMWLSGVSPYATAPRDWPEADAVDSLAPFSHMRTIYPAVSQATFAAAAAIERAVMQPIDRIPPGTSNERSPWRRYLASPATPYRASVFRLIFAAAAVAMTAVLLRLLWAQGRSPWWAVLVAWHPLATLEIGGMGHQDVLGVLLVLLGLYALTTGRRAASGVCLALAAAVKPYAIFLLPFIPRRSAFAFIAVLLAAYFAPALYQSGHVGWRASARIYSQSWEANGSIYEVIQRTFGSGDEGRASERGKHMSRLLAAATVLATALTAWRFRAASATAGYWICLAALLASPVVYPWYLLWALCFVPLLRGEAGWTALVWSGTIGLSYVVWHQPMWRMTNSMLLAEYGVVYAALALELAHAIRRTRAAARRTTADATSDSQASLFPPPLRGWSA